MDKPLINGQSVIFAGRRWEVLNINSEQKVISLKKAKGGKPPKFGGALGLAVVLTLQLSWNHFYQGQLREHVTAGSVATQSFLANVTARMEQFPLPNPELAATQLLYQRMTQQAAVLTFNSLFEAMAIMFFCAIPLIFLIKKVRVGGSGGEAH